jgi:beta-lactamase class A
MKMKRRLILAAPTLLAPATLARPAEADAFSDFFLHYEMITGGHIGFYAHDLKSGQKLAWRENEQFLMCSTYKMSLVACVLARVDRRQETLEHFLPYGAADLVEYSPVAQHNLAKGGMSIAAMCQAAVEVSDNTCANQLLASIGGPTALTKFWRATGDGVSRLDHNEPMVNRTPLGNPDDTTTPAAMASNVKRFLLGETLTPASRRLLTGWMLNCQTGTNLLRAGLPGWKLADKTGNNGKDALGDIAMGWPQPERAVLICVYTRGGSPNPDSLRPIFADIGRLVGQHLG